MLETDLYVTYCEEAHSLSLGGLIYGSVCESCCVFPAKRFDQRLYESLQRHLELVRETVERAKRNQSKTDQADRNIEQSESSIEGAERGINRSQHNIKHTQRGIENSKQQVEERVKQVQTEQRIKSRGWSR